MKQLKKVSKMFLMLSILFACMAVVSFAYAQGADTGEEGGSDIFTTISMIANAILGVVTFFVGKGLNSANVYIAKVSERVQSITTLLNYVQESFSDNKLTPEELKRIADLAKAIVQKPLPER